MARTLYLPPTYPEQSADHEFPADVVELVRAAAGSGEIRRTSIETTWPEQILDELPIGRPIRTEGRRPWRTTYVAVDALVFEVPVVDLDPLILDLVPKLQEKGYTAYGTLKGVYELPPPDYRRTWSSPSRPETMILAVIESKDPYEPLRIEDPSGADIPTSELIRTLEEWRQFSSFEIAAVNDRVLDLAFRSLPPKLTSFARFVYNFNFHALREVLLVEPRDNWDTIHYIRAMDAQTTGDLVRHLRKTKHLRLVWP